MESGGEVMGIIKKGNPILEKPCEYVKGAGYKTKLNKFLIRSVPLREKGVGIAANQVGLTDRICTIKLNNGRWITMLNPTIKQPFILINRNNNDIIESTEGCLSIGKKEYTVERYTEIIVEFYDMNFQPQRLDLYGQEAIIAQHEIDHLDGILISDKVEGK